MQRSRRQSAASLSPAQAQYVLARLVKDRKVSQADIQQYAGFLNEEIASLEARLAALRSVGGEGAASEEPARATVARVAQNAATVADAPRARRKQTLSPARRRALKFHGQYLSLVRTLSATARAKVKKFYEANGVEATVKMLQRTAKK